MELIYDIELRFIIFIPYCDVYKRFIDKCLKSINNQLYSNYEVVIVNDGSKERGFIEKLVEGNPKYTLIHCETNNGPASSKWVFLNHIQQNGSKYSPNDIIIVIDGDDYLNGTDVFSIINRTYQQHKCWMTYGNADGNYCNTNSITDIPNDWENIRHKEWIYNHPRTFKVALALTFNESDFKIDGAWLTKGTDRPLIYNCIELAGKSRCKSIKNVLYNYIEHENNSYKTVAPAYKYKQLEHLRNITPKSVIVEDIHIVMCCWKRYENLEEQIECLNEQTVASRIHLHLLNNNIEGRVTLIDLVNMLSQSYTNIKISLSHYNNEYYGFQRFLYTRDTLLKQYNIDYVIFIDDDQLFSVDWVEKLYKLRKPKTYSCWYGKLWQGTKVDYWEDSIICKHACHYNTNLQHPHLHFGATCGAIIDTTIFSHSSKLWEVPVGLRDNTLVYNIEDLWLSFIVRKVYGWVINRSFLPELRSLNTPGSSSEKQCLYVSLYNQKRILMQYLIDRYGLS